MVLQYVAVPCRSCLVLPCIISYLSLFALNVVVNVTQRDFKSPMSLVIVFLSASFTYGSLQISVCFRSRFWNFRSYVGSSTSISCGGEDRARLLTHNPAKNRGGQRKGVGGIHTHSNLLLLFFQPNEIQIIGFLH